MSCIVMLQTSCPRSYVRTAQQDFDDPQTLARRSNHNNHCLKLLQKFEELTLMLLPYSHRHYKYVLHLTDGVVIQNIRVLQNFWQVFAFITRALRSAICCRWSPRAEIGLWFRQAEMRSEIQFPEMDFWVSFTCSTLECMIFPLRIS